MTSEERQKKLEECAVKFAIVGFLKENGKRDACLCISDLDFAKELNKFQIYKTYKLVEIHKR